METVGVFFGSRSPEHDVSIITGQLIIAGLKGLDKYNVVPVYIGKDGVWYSGDELSSLSFFSKPDKETQLRSFSGWSLNMRESQGKLVLEKRGFFGKRKICIDVAFPAFHGQNGEDGTIQGLYELCDVPYVGCDVPASAITMDKVITKLLYEKFQLPTAKFVYFENKEWNADKVSLLNNISSTLTFPLFVKPARLGSSIGIAKAKDAKSLEFAIEVALHYDSKVLVEEAVANVMDVTCSVIGTYSPRASYLQESIYTGSDLFSYEEKYLNDGGAQLGKAVNRFVIPARISTEKTEEMRALAVRVFKLFGLSGVSRVDFLFDTVSEKIYVNEINTLPGTLYHHQWKASGVEISELLLALLSSSLERSSDRKKMMLTFESDILKNMSAGKLSQKLSPPTS